MAQAIEFASKTKPRFCFATMKNSLRGIFQNIFNSPGTSEMRIIDGIQFNSLSEFFAMGGYAFNVWSVYALFAVFLIVNLALPLRRRKLILREQKRRLAALDARQDSDRDPADSAGWKVGMAGDGK